VLLVLLGVPTDAKAAPATKPKIEVHLKEKEKKRSTSAGSGSCNRHGAPRRLPHTETGGKKKKITIRRPRRKKGAEAE